MSDLSVSTNFALITSVELLKTVLSDSQRPDRSRQNEPFAGRLKACEVCDLGGNLGGNEIELSP